MSNATPREHQGVAASLMNTVVNYSISIGLGLAGTAESQLNRGGTDILRGYHAAWYIGIGLAGLGWAVSLHFVVSGHGKRGTDSGANSSAGSGAGSESKSEAEGDSEG